MEHTPILATKKKKSTETVVGRSPPDHNEKFPEPHSPHALQPKFVAIQTGRSERTLPSTFDSVESKRKQLCTYNMPYSTK